MCIALTNIDVSFVGLVSKEGWPIRRAASVEGWPGRRSVGRLASQEVKPVGRAVGRAGH